VKHNDNVDLFRASWSSEIGAALEGKEIKVLLILFGKLHSNYSSFPPFLFVFNVFPSRTQIELFFCLFPYDAVLIFMSSEQIEDNVAFFSPL
jgi:hypothetical protein